MPKQKRETPDRIHAMIREVEKTAKRLGVQIRKRATAVKLPKDLQTAAVQLRRRAAIVAAQVEKYVHELRTGLERGGTIARSKPKRRR